MAVNGLNCAMKTHDVCTFLRLAAVYQWLKYKNLTSA